jgi:ADP-ribose pyrophosphatase
MTGRTWTHPDVLTVGIDQGWADPETDPALIDWPARLAAAAIPYAVTADGRPVNPRASTGITRGRNELGRWGENLMADALVTVIVSGGRLVLMVERGDGLGWAVPGGAADPGETGEQAALRELAEETGLIAPAGAYRRELRPVYVPDPRASDEAWAVTVPVIIDLDEMPAPPPVAGADDARRAAWLPAASYAEMAAAVAALGGRVFPAHVEMLARYLGGAA